MVSVIHDGCGTDTPGDKYFYYSDEVVKDVPATDVFSDKSAQGVSPALLCYVRKDRSLVDTLHRAAAPVEGEAGAEVAETASTGGW